MMATMQDRARSMSERDRHQHVHGRGRITRVDEAAQ